MPYVLLFYALLNVATFIVYANDKEASEQGWQRFSENTLHWMALFGGWPAAYVAQRYYGHKTSKQPFQTYFIGCVFINIFGFIYWVYRYWN
jgi:uncharacterized membrane protein YsdA (DUF1294 family)